MLSWFDLYGLLIIQPMYQIYKMKKKTLEMCCLLFSYLTSLWIYICQRFLNQIFTYLLQYLTPRARLSESDIKRLSAS